MSEPHTADVVTDPPATDAGEQWPPGFDPDVPPPHAKAAAAAYRAELDELLAHLAAHPDEQWVAYHWGQRIGFGSDRPAFERECLRKYPGGGFFIYGIDPVLRHPEDTRL